MALLLRLEHHLDVRALLGTQPALLLAQVEALRLVDLLRLDEPVNVELVRVSDFEGAHEAGLALAEDASVEGDVVRLQVDHWLDAAADQTSTDGLDYELIGAAEFERNPDVELLQFLGDELDIQADFYVRHQSEHFLIACSLCLFS